MAVSFLFSGFFSCFFSSPSLAQVCHIYVIGKRGVVTNSFSQQGFQGTQFLVMRSPGYRGNPVDFRLTNSIDINNGRVGQIELSTNSATSSNLGRRGQLANLARVTTLSNRLLNVNLIPEANIALPPVNAFVAPGIGTAPGGLGEIGFLPGAGGDIARIINGSFILQRGHYTPVNGRVQVNFSGDWRTIAGRLETLGVQIDNFSNRAVYVSNFSGRLWRSQRCP